jgi:hypothetical protein
VFLYRYAVPSLLGTGLLAGYVFAHAVHRYPRIAPLPWIASFTLILASPLLSGNGNVDLTGRLMRLVQLSHSSPTLDIVVADPLLYPPLQQGNSALKQRLLFLTDRQMALQGSDPLPEVALQFLRQWQQLRVVPLGQQLTAARPFLIFSNRNSRREWLVHHLERIGWQVKELAAEGDQQLFFVQPPGTAQNPTPTIPGRSKS